MLLILYGAIAEMGYKSREYLNKAGFQTVEKYHYAVTPMLTTKFGARNFVSEEVFLENTDSMFRYEVGGITVGFSQQQISDAVCNKTNRLLPISTRELPAPFISALSEIKHIYAENVCLIYAYIDDRTLQNIISGLENISDEEARVRYEIGCDVKRNYLQYQHIFDHVIMYGGEDSIFNYDSLYRQFDAIIKTMQSDDVDDTHYSDVFVFCISQPRDAAICEQVYKAMVYQGIKVSRCFQETANRNWPDRLVRAIQNAKIVIPIITNNALTNTWVLEGTRFALECAEKNGTLIIPVFEDGVDMDRNPYLKSKLEMLSGIMFRGDQVADAANRLTDKLSKLLSAETNLKAFSKQVENYLCLKMYDQAKNFQEAHLTLCDEVFAMSNGAFIDFEACLQSRIKLISILLDMQLYEQALEHIIEALNLGEDSDIYDVLEDQFAICCACLDMDADAVRKLALDRLSAFVALKPEFAEDDKVQKYLHHRMEELLENFRNALNIVEANRMADKKECIGHAADEDKIAEYGELAIALFEDLIQERSKQLSRHDLILGYERILNYCKHVGLKGEVADKCISRIAALSAQEDTTGPSEKSTATEALKIYLGQATPQSGEYDAFLSFKEEDEVLARKVYDYLTQSGKEVFFYKETLPQLGKSEYEEIIFTAIERSRHMVLVSSNPDYLKTKWVMDEWSTFNAEIREGRKTGNLVLLLADDVAGDKGRLPLRLRQKEIVKMSEFRNRLLSYLR